MRFSRAMDGSVAAFAKMCTASAALVMTTLLGATAVHAQESVGRRSEFEASGSVAGAFLRHRRPQAADVRNSVLRVRADFRHEHLRGLEESAGAPLDAGSFRADLRDLQDVPDHAGQVPDAAVGVHRRHDRPVLRRAAEIRSVAGGDDSRVQRAGNRREATAWRGSEFA